MWKTLQYGKGGMASKRDGEVHSSSFKNELNRLIH